ncbi:MAG: CinA family protein [Clostridia bacterium]|jgi:PncC family amidohydrolase|nr:CinA family protein [Clostridia bacterium]
MKKLIDHLLENNITVATAESCTGGNISAEFVSYAGVSSIFLGGLCTYHNSVKESVLSVKSETLKDHGAVSRECAEEMLKGAIKATGAMAAVCTTGIAGPTGGTKEKPVGLVYIGAIYKDKLTVEKCNFSGTRKEIIEQAKQYALELLYKTVGGK